MNLFVSDLTVKIGFAFLKQKVGGTLGGVLFGGPIGFVLGFFLEKFLNTLITEGIIRLDIMINRAKEFMSLDDYTKFVKGAYAKANSKVYSEAEKVVIRKQYLAALRAFAPHNGGVR